MTEKQYPTEEAWNYFCSHREAIRGVCEEYLPRARMEVPNTRIYITTPGGDEIETHWRASVPLPVKNTIAAFDRACEIKDSKGLYNIMNDAWFRLPESRSIYRQAGVTEMCNLLDFTVEGFVPGGPDEDEGEG